MNMLLYVYRMHLKCLWWQERNKSMRVKKCNNKTTDRK